MILFISYGVILLSFVSMYSWFNNIRYKLCWIRVSEFLINRWRRFGVASKFYNDQTGQDVSPDSIIVRPPRIIGISPAFHGHISMLVIWLSCPTLLYSPRAWYRLILMCYPNKVVTSHIVIRSTFVKERHVFLAGRSFASVLEVGCVHVGVFSRVTTITNKRFLELRTP